jgi:NADH dehydrogenase/NADH:ubiquinone oxidoreductase subunit G
VVNLTIDGRQIKAKEGMTVLQAAREHGIDIPTLCHNEALEPYGACRICLVEITYRNGRTRLVTSCLYPVEEGLAVSTDSERVTANRKILVELLLARCSREKVIQDLARKLGVDGVPFRPEYVERNACILCAQCVRACQEVVGASAISLANRGVSREVAPPFLETATACIGCGSCVYICPTQCIKMEDVGDTRFIYNWKVEFKLKKCRVCGNHFAPEAQLEYIRAKANLPPGFFDTCPTCR